MKGYKIVYKDWTSHIFTSETYLPNGSIRFANKGMKYAPYTIYVMDEDPVLCERGMHFSQKLNDCFIYNDISLTRIRALKVEAFGSIDYGIDGTKFCTDKLKIFRCLTNDEICDILLTEGQEISEAYKEYPCRFLYNFLNRLQFVLTYNLTLFSESRRFISEGFANYVHDLLVEDKI